MTPPLPRTLVHRTTIASLALIFGVGTCGGERCRYVDVPHPPRVCGRRDGQSRRLASFLASRPRRDGGRDLGGKTRVDGEYWDRQMRRAVAETSGREGVDRFGTVVNPLTGRKIGLGGKTYESLILSSSFPPGVFTSSLHETGRVLRKVGPPGAWVYFDGSMHEIDCQSLSRWKQFSGSYSGSALTPSEIDDFIYDEHGDSAIRANYLKTDDDGSTLINSEDWQELVLCTTQKESTTRTSSKKRIESLELLFVLKPSGLLTVPGRGEHKRDSLTTRMAASARSAAKLVHRLDRDTSGAMIFGLNARSQREASAQFERRTAQKWYVALVAGHPTADRGTVNLPIGKAPVGMEGGHSRWTIGGEGARKAETRWKVLDRFRRGGEESAGGGADFSRVLLRPLTGRGQQLRLHMKALGHPILGDTIHAPPLVAGCVPRLCLHAKKLSLTVNEDDKIDIKGIYPGKQKETSYGMSEGRISVTTPWDPF